MKPRSQKPPHGKFPQGKPAQDKAPKGGAYWLYGRHACVAAAANPDRKILRAMATEASAASLPAKLRPELAYPEDFQRLLPRDSVHQGVALLVEPLPEPDLSVLAASGKLTGPVLLLDQVTDPHNVGAILRSAAAFDASAVIMLRHNAPEENGALAKAASGALEVVPVIRAGNLTQAMDQLKEYGYWIAGLAGDAPKTLSESKLSSKTGLVLGAEGEGMRRLTRERCDLLVRLPISSKMESLNVSNAAAVALYALCQNGA
ncbi:MAG: 23S rRNA (guanosine(2251)-2'-O)-methyltransferase RlmB [Alphaproteobacteria bacterium]|nr:23S rRNA (guanosine(2251)-2'-O)-methyltransferase RlmB [Alphaproteobacteria bacterium]